VGLYFNAFLLISALIILGADAPFPTFYYSQTAGILLLAISVRLIIKGECNE
jgi:hypothetical protein